MVDQSKVGTDWSADELDAIVADYFIMLSAQANGQSFVKAQRARDLDAQIGRGHKSIEFKHMNISAVLTELGLPIIRGYRPMTNYQRAIFPALERYLDAHPAAWDIGMPSAVPSRPGMNETAPAFSSPWNGEGDRAAVEGLFPPHVPSTDALIPITAPPPRTARKPRPPELARVIRKFDPADRDHRNRVLGQWGEYHVFHHERAFLIAHDRPDLARKIEWTSQEHGDGAGYDIRSFDPTGAERLIEVKATRGGPATDFYLTRTEREVSEDRPDAWCLYRLHDLAATPGLFQLKPPLESAVTLTAETWRAGF